MSVTSLKLPDELTPGDDHKVREAVQILVRHPLIGRLAETHRRELITLKGRTGYVAFCRWLDAHWRSSILINVKRDIREFRQGRPCVGGPAVRLDVNAPGEPR
ncbi:MAG: hypothetical protein ACT4QB_12805 [Gammaproteobacteria bacterium]